MATLDALKLMLMLLLAVGLVLAGRQDDNPVKDYTDDDTQHDRN